MSSKKLECKHRFHKNCLNQRVKKRQGGGRASQDRSAQMRGQQPNQRGPPPGTGGSASGAAFNESRPIEINSLSKVVH